MREIVLDTETTGLNFAAGDRIIEVGCVELINHISSGNKLQFYCSVDKKINNDALKIHGLTNDFLNSHPPFKDHAEDLLDFIKEDTLIIHNAEFDLGFINNELNILGKKPIKNNIIDTVSLARKKLNTRIANLDYLCRKFSIDLSKRSLHGALLDCFLLAEVYLELIGGKQISMNLNITKNIEENMTQNSKNPLYIFSKIIPTKNEILKHKQLIKQIKNSVWEKIDY
jgi:DNA polymerase-3 subunit epsilon